MHQTATLTTDTGVMINVGSSWDYPDCSPACLVNLDGACAGDNCNLIDGRVYRTSGTTDCFQAIGNEEPTTTLIIGYALTTCPTRECVVEDSFSGSDAPPIRDAFVNTDINVDTTGLLTNPSTLGLSSMAVSVDDGAGNQVPIDSTFDGMFSFAAPNIVISQPTSGYDVFLTTFKFTFKSLTCGKVINPGVLTHNS